MDKPIEQCALFKSAFEYSPNAIILTDLDGVITDVNQAFLELYEWNSEDVLGSNSSLIRSPKTDDAFFKAMWKSILETGQWQGEIVNQSKSGREITVLLTITQIIKDGEKIGYMGIDIDRTNHIRMQEHIAQSERLATIGQMAAKIAHEIRNPLSSISLNAELLEDELISEALDKEEARLLLSSIMNEVDRLANLTNEYLQFSRLPRLQNGAHDICKLFKNLVTLVSPELISNKIEFEIKTPNQEIILDFDKDQIHRVFLNLVRNSIEAMPNGGIISLSVTEKDHFVETILSDTGQGIPMDQIGEVFTPFYTTKDIGTGLGLPISKQIIEEHGGTMSYISDEETGACFRITLPYKQK